DWAVFYAPSLNVLLVCSENAKRKAQTNQETILSIGNPTFDRQIYPNLPMLQNAEREAREIGSLFSRPTYLLGQQANKSDVLRAMQSAEVIHFAGHYIVDDSNPLLSKMLLAAQEGYNPEEQNSALSVSEILEHGFDHTFDQTKL